LITDSHRAAFERDASLRGPPFDALTEGRRSRLLSATTLRTVSKRQRLFRQGDHAEHILVVLGGALVRTGVTEQGKELALGVLSPGEILGVLPLLDGGPRSTDAIALVDSAVASIPYRAVADELQRSPPFAVALARMVAGEVRHARSTAFELLSATGQGRLAAVLLDLARRFGLSSAVGVVIDLPLVQEDLAILVGVARETLSRHLSGLVSHGLVARLGRRYVVRDIPGMEQVAAGGSLAPVARRAWA
jgi:CRP-like cAMP-binding protein